MGPTDFSQRRRFLAALATGIAGGLAGCTGSSDTETTTPLPIDPDTEAEGSEEQRETTEGSDTQQPPEPRFVVNNDGSGDYETLQKAYDVAKTGDVIKVESGEYAYQPEVTTVDNRSGEAMAKTLVFVGVSPTETSIQIESPEYEDENSEGSLDHPYENADPTFWNTTLDVAEGLEFDTNGQIPLRLQNARIQGGIGSATDLVAYDSVIDFSPDSVPKVDVRECVFEQDIGLSGEVTDCVFNAYCRGPFDADIATLRINDSELRSGVQMRAGDLEINRCSISHRSDSLVAVEVTDEPSNLSIVDSEIEGRITASETGEINDDYLGRIRSITGCRFVAPEDLEYFIDGYPVVNLWFNSFEGADIRITTPPEEAGEATTVYDEGREVGNYYSEWDGGEDRGDGVSALPREIPGDAGVVDQYPLLEADLDQYSDRSS